MGQKVNPYGIRLGINKTWSSRWFSKKDYVKFQEIAKKNRVGIWSGKFLMPWEWRKKNK